ASRGTNSSAASTAGHSRRTPTRWSSWRGEDEVTATLPSPYEAPELYDQALQGFQEDLGFWLDEARRAAPAPGRAARVLEVGCGTGRVLLHLQSQGIDVEGVDLHAPMLARLEAKAKALSLTPRVARGDMRDFTTPHRYHRVFIPFNAFAHCETV